MQGKHVFEKHFLKCYDWRRREWTSLHWKRGYLKRKKIHVNCKETDVPLCPLRLSIYRSLILAFIPISDNCWLGWKEKIRYLLLFFIASVEYETWRSAPVQRCAVSFHLWKYYHFVHTLHCMSASNSSWMCLCDEYLFCLSYLTAASSNCANC